MQTTIRYFIYYDDGQDDYGINECSESEFLAFDGVIDYVRHTIRENGVNQVCLTKGLPRE